MFFAAPAGIVKSVVVKDATNGAPQTVKQKTVYVTGAKSTTYPNGYRTAMEASVCHTSDRILICGRLQSRIYTKLTEEGIEERTAYEISALTAEFPKTT